MREITLPKYVGAVGIVLLLAIVGALAFKAGLDQGYDRGVAYMKEIREESRVAVRNMGLCTYANHVLNEYSCTPQM